MQAVCCRSQALGVAVRPRGPCHPSLQHGASSSHTCWPAQRRVVARAYVEDEGGEDMDAMKADMERFQRTKQQQQQQSASSSSEAAPPAASPIKEAIDKLLIADFFVVLAILAWLGLGLVEKSIVQSSVLVDAWMPLWPMVFQPAIGVLMAGALVLGGLNWLEENSSAKGR